MPAGGNRAYGFEAVLAERETAGLLRRQHAFSDRAGVEFSLNGRPLINFCSNDYLGLACHPRLISAWSEAAQHYGVGAGAAPLVCGRLDIHDQLERALAEFTGRERALLFPDGFQANLGVIPALAQGRNTRVLMDRLCHASLIDGARLSRARFRRFRHGAPAALQERLQTGDHGFTLVVTESVFSMDGDVAPLAEYARLCSEYRACLYVDDAHGFGVLGEAGRGGLERAGLTQTDAPLMMATFGKALGVAGAFVSGSATLVETLVQYARPYIYSTAMPPAQAAAVLAALELMQEEDWRRRYLMDRVRQFRRAARQAGLPLGDSGTPIQPLIVGSADKALAVSERLQQRGYYVTAMRPPTVPENSARLRITLSAAHSEEQVAGLVAALAGVLAE